MSVHRAPLLIDQCSAADFAGKVNASLARRDFHVEKGHAPSALVEVFARFCEIVAQRLNQAPDKARLAFLDMLGASPVPPQPARVPLTFSVSVQSPTVAFVPAGTQVGAAVSKGEQQPVVFEVQHDLVVTTARLAWLALRDGHHVLSPWWRLVNFAHRCRCPVVVSAPPRVLPSTRCHWLVSGGRNVDRELYSGG